MTPTEVRKALRGFRPGYAVDWEEWLAVSESDRSDLFIKILGKWRAVRPGRMRDAQAIQSLRRRARPHVRVLGSLNMQTFLNRSPEQDKALRSLWRLFGHLRHGESASVVGISKATLLLTNGRIGPAFDSKVCGRLRLRKATNAQEWLDDLDDVARDIENFERTNGPLGALVKKKYKHLDYGRLYDMVFGPASIA